MNADELELAVVQSSLHLYQAFDYHGLVFDNERSESEAMFNHRFVEASKFAFGLRNSIGDERFNDSSEVLLFLLLFLFQFKSQFVFLFNFMNCC